MARVEFTKQMKDQGYTLLAPDMLPIHFNMLIDLFANHGYNLKLLNYTSKESIDEGLKYVHNDTCYPALIVIGQLMHALHSGEYDLNRTALLLTQTGGGCRASNYIHLLRKALEKDGLGHIPVISLNTGGLESNSGFKLGLRLIFEMLSVVVYGDLIMLLKNQVEPYQTDPSACDKIIDKWGKIFKDVFNKGKGHSRRERQKYLKLITEDFKRVEIVKTPRVKVGLVGEIYVKYAPAGNNDIQKLLLEQGCEVNVPGLLGFLCYCADHVIDDIALYGGSRIKRLMYKYVMKFLINCERDIIRAVKDSGVFEPPAPFYEIKDKVRPIIGINCTMGEGWLLTAEMNELIEAGFSNIVCMQPFGCLPNHIVGKGMIRKLKNLYPDSNIVPIDYDPGATKVNQENRIKLMLAVARENLEEAAVIK